VFASIYRLVSIQSMKRDDIPYTIQWLIIWTFVEPCIGLVCGSLPIIRGLLPAYKAKISPKTSANVPMKKGSGVRDVPFSGASHFLTSIGHDVDWSQSKEEEEPGVIRVKTVIEIV